MTTLQKTVLIVGGILIVLGLLKPDLSGWGGKVSPVHVDVMELTPPSDAKVKKEADDVVALLKSLKSNKKDVQKLRDLCLDLGTLVGLDGENEVVKNTEEIRQANSLAGVMLRLDIKGKYPNLAKEAQDVVIAAIGDDNIVLSKELRPKAVDGLNALAWAYNEASK